MCPPSTDSIRGVLKIIYMNMTPQSIISIIFYKEKLGNSLMYLLANPILNVHCTLQVSISDEQTETFRMTICGCKAKKRQIYAS